jgi:hypothetical protein
MNLNTFNPTTESQSSTHVPHFVKQHED